MYLFWFIGLALQCTGQNLTSIKPGEYWPDQFGKHINAHGGGILRAKNTYYWFGEEYKQNSNEERRYVSCYSSKDLVNWQYKGSAFSMHAPDTSLSKWVLERPKVFYNAKTKKYVMYMHIDGEIPGQGGDYNFAKVGIAVSDKVTGPFVFVRCFRPLGRESRDIGQFVDDDGSAYLLFEDRPSGGFHIAKLSEDYLDIKEDICFIKSPLEGGAIVKSDNLYYVLGSALTGWKPNPNKYATAVSLKGPWSEFKDIAPQKTRTYNSQSTFLLKVVGQRKTTVVFLGDQWEPLAKWNSKYLWMPLEIANGKLWLPEPKPWTINVKTGEVKFINP